jgi:hypothetical protein
MIDLWELLVEYVFGSYWITLIAIMITFFFIMCIYGNLSKETASETLMIFFLAMSIGYSLSLAILVIILMLFIDILTINKLLNIGER